MEHQFLTNYTEITFLDKIKDNLRHCKSFDFSVSAGKTVELPTNVDAELLAKVLSNPEMAALLSTLAKSLESK